MDTHASFGIVTKEEVERWANDYEDNGIVLTDSQWSKIADELEGRVANFLDNLLSEIIVDIISGVYDE